MEFFSNVTQWNDWGLLALRLSLAAIFLKHGIMKLGMWKMQPSEQMPAKMLSMIKILSIAEPLGGLAMLFGFLTQFAAVGFGIIMLGAINLKIRMWKTPFTAQNTTGWEFDLLILASSVALFFLGAGGIALDRVIFGI